MGFLKFLKPAGRILLHTLLPPHCLACDVTVEQDGQFCQLCFKRINFISVPYCSQCGVPLPYGGIGGKSGVCVVCEETPPVFTRARAALRYDDAAKSLILPFKYADKPEAARGLAILMAKAGAGLLARADILVPVPLHKVRLRQRRYNQSALLATAVARIAGKPVRLNALSRQRSTIPLGPLGFDARRAELAGAITAPKISLTGLSVLLIDDIMTSGATANACAMALSAAGAARVDVLTIARVPDPRLQ